MPTQKPVFHRAWLSDPPGILVIARLDGAFVQSGPTVLLALSVVPRECMIAIEEIEAAVPVGPGAGPGLPPQYATKRFPAAKAREFALTGAVITNHGEVEVGEALAAALDEHMRLVREAMHQSPALFVPGVPS